MIVLDTNVLSELMRPSPSAMVEAWVAGQPASQLYTTVITQVEIFYGIGIMSTERKRAELLKIAEAILAVDLAGRVFPFDEDAASVMPHLMIHRRSMGRPIGHMDAQIAAITRSHGAALATRNTAHFADCGIDVIDPWARR